MIIGAIADDFTGATDLASILAKGGMRVVLAVGVPKDTVHEADAVVVALKSRTVPVAEAVEQSLEALRWLRGKGARQILFKYCSTFDSTPDGNIGPVADALSDALDARGVVVCPAFPGNGRTVYQGHLFVEEQLLENSSMRDHPLTPMRRSNVVELMREQSAHDVGLVAHATVARGPEAIRDGIDQAGRDGQRYVVVDAVSDDDLVAIGRAVHDIPLITGGSAIALALPGNHGFEPKDGRYATAPGPGRTAILVGSCSVATRQQLSRATKLWPSFRLDMDKIAGGQDVAADAMEWVLRQPEDLPVVVYGSADPLEVQTNQERYGRERAGTLMEDAFSNLVRKIVPAGVSRMIVAGGETSGAVVSALEIEALEIGNEIAPGVPWTRAHGALNLQLALKSGNFGGPDFFERALETSP